MGAVNITQIVFALFFVGKKKKDHLIRRISLFSFCATDFQFIIPLVLMHIHCLRNMAHFIKYCVRLNEQVQLHANRAKCVTAYELKRHISQTNKHRSCDAIPYGRFDLSANKHTHTSNHITRKTKTVHTKIEESANTHKTENYLFNYAHTPWCGYPVLYCFYVHLPGFLEFLALRDIYYCVTYEKKPVFFCQTWLLIGV